jgi:hypothetical protein
MHAVIFKMAPKTEDLGKIFEMAICLVYSIPYIGKYKYGMDEPVKLVPRISQLQSLFPMCIHTAKHGARYDFTSGNDHLSAKTTKGNGRIAPQVIGQPQPKKFCEIIGVNFTNIIELKKHIQLHIQSILPTLVDFTFDCPILYYNAKKNIIKFIKLTAPISWEMHKYSWSCDWTEWNNTSTVKIEMGGVAVPLVEFQFHTKNRTNMAIRWCFENFLETFARHLDITVLDIEN